jgi:hypothetical protein
MAEDAKRLLVLQLAYERELEHKFQFAGLSVNDFIYTLLSEGYGKRAEKVRADWRVPDKRSVFSSSSPPSPAPLYQIYLPPHLLPTYPSSRSHPFHLSPSLLATSSPFLVSVAHIPRFWWIKIKALARNKDWDGLETFAKSKKSPIGYEPFVVSRLS